MPRKTGLSHGVEVESLLREWFGLRSYEVKIYLAMLKGNRSPKEISTISRVPLPRVYDTLRSLEEKGFVHHTVDGPIAAPPSVALESRSRQLEAESKERETRREQTKKKLIPLLSSLFREGREESSEVVLVRGLSSIAQHLAEIMSESKEVFLLVRKALQAKELFLQYVETLPLDRMKVRVILPTGARITQRERDRASKLGVELREHANPLLDLAVVDRQYVILGVPDPLSKNDSDAVAVSVRNPSFARALQESLESLWRESVKFA